MELITKSNRRFLHIGFKPHVKKDGSKTELMVWESSCVECGEKFTVTTPSTCTSINDSKAFGQCRCDRHVNKTKNVSHDFFMNVISKK